MDFGEEQYDSLSFKILQGVISQKDISYEQDQFRVN